jgi:bifunctional non-homologous end joining protein LigD
MARKPSSLRTGPCFVEPMAAHAVKVLPEGAEWLYELKLDGFRALLIKDSQPIRLRSRKDKDLASAYPTIAAAGRSINAEQVVLDGEIVVLDQHGRPSLNAVQHRGALLPQHQVVFYAFDMLHLNGRDLTGDPLHQRRTEIPALLTGTVLRVCPELPGTAADVEAAVRGMGLEGIVAKRRDSTYEPGERSSSWVKLKLQHQQEFVVGGYRPDGESSIDALVVGYFEEDRLRYCGKVRAGFVPHTRRDLCTKLKPLRADPCPFSDLPTGRSQWGSGITALEMREFRWTRPELVVQVRFTAWTSDARLRDAAFVGLRPDKSPGEVCREQ